MCKTSPQQAIATGPGYSEDAPVIGERAMTLLGFEVFVFQIGECGIDNGREFFKTNVGCCVRDDATNVWS